MTNNVADIQQQIKDYMAKDLRNTIITWKRQQTDCQKAEDFNRFLFDLFPENIDTEFRASMARACLSLDDKEDDFELRESAFATRFSATRVKWVDHRVQGNEWKSVFGATRAQDEIVELGAPPGSTFDEMEDIHQGERLPDFEDDCDEFTLRDAFGRDLDALKQAAATFLEAEFPRGLLHTNMRQTDSSAYSSDSDEYTSEEDSDSSDDDSSSSVLASTASTTLSFWQRAKRSVASGLQELSETFDEPQECEDAPVVHRNPEFSYAADSYMLY
jgi:hypothetical protein